MNMNSCKPGDKLVCRNGGKAIYFDKNGTPHFPHRVRFSDIKGMDSVNDQGYNSYVDNGTYPHDIVSSIDKFSKEELLQIIEEYRNFQNTGILCDGLLRNLVSDKPLHLIAVTVPYVMLDIFLIYAEKTIKEQ